MRFFVDNNIAPRLARGFNQFVAGEHEFVHLRDRFPADAPDVKWMHDLAGESNWVIISGDVAIRKNPHEVAAWKEAGHVIFFLKPGWTNIPFWQQVEKLAQRFEKIEALARRAQPGDSFMVGVRGEIEE